MPSPFSALNKTAIADALERRGWLLRATIIGDSPFRYGLLSQMGIPECSTTRPGRQVGEKPLLGPPWPAAPVESVTRVPLPSSR